MTPSVFDNFHDHLKKPPSLKNGQDEIGSSHLAKSVVTMAMTVKIRQM